MNVKDPYSEMIKLMQQHGAKYNPPGVQLGEVTSTSPLTIHTGDIQLNSNNLLVADYLLPGYTRTVSVDNINVSGKTDSQNIGDHGSHYHNIASLSFSGEQKYTDGLNVNDIVVLIQIDAATFVVFCKVVKP